MSRIKISASLFFLSLGLSMLGIIIPILGGVFLVIAGILGLDILANRRGYHMKIPFIVKSNDKGFYRDRSEMIKDRGSLDNELKLVSNAWVAFEVGTHYSGIEISLIPRVRRVLMLDPTCQLLEDWTTFNGTTQQAIEAIKAVTQQCLSNNDVQVKWTTNPLMNCLIGDPDTEKAWIRVNCQIPLTQSAKWPSYMVYKEQEPDRFRDLLFSYDNIWNNANSPDSAKLSTPYTQDSKPGPTPA